MFSVDLFIQLNKRFSLFGAAKRNKRDRQSWIELFVTMYKKHSAETLFEDWTPSTNSLSNIPERWESKCSSTLLRAVDIS